MIVMEKLNFRSLRQVRKFLCSLALLFDSSNLGSPWGVWCGGGGGRGVAMLISIVTGGYHSRTTYKWSFNDQIMENEKYPIIYVTEDGIYKCLCTSVLPELSAKTEARFLVKKGMVVTIAIRR